MSLEDIIQNNTKAIEQNTIAILKLCSTATSAPAAEVTTRRQVKDKPAPEPEKAAAPQFTVADIRGAAQKLLDLQRVDLIRPLLPKYGVEKISAAAPEKYADVMADLAAALATAEKEKGAVV